MSPEGPGEFGGDGTTMLSVMLIIVYVADIQVSALLIFMILRSQRLTPARAALIGYLGATAMWSAIAIHWQLSSTPDAVITQALILPVVAVLVSAVRLAARGLEDPKWRPSRSYVVSLLAHPFVMIVLAAVAPWHGFLVTVDASGKASYATGFWIHAAVSYALVASAGVRFVRARSKIRAISRYSAARTFLPWSLPFIANAITVSDQGAGGPEFTPIAFLITVVIIARVFVQDGLADIVPIARLHVFESFTDAILVVDSDGCLVDANARALRLLGEERDVSEIAGTRLDTLSTAVSDMCQFNGEHDIDVAGNSLVMSVRRSPLRDVRGQTVGALIHVRDITVDVVQRRELVRVRDALADEAMVNEALRAELAEQVVRDAGTGLHNRRFVFETMPLMAEACDRKGEPFSVIALDVDRFKEVNDTHGHAVGDRTLQAIATALVERSSGATVARIGGEEFVVLLPGSTTGEAVARAEDLRAACAAIEILTREGSISVTLSAGVATAEPGSTDFTSLLDAADGALYDAKNGGRNRVCSAAAVAT